MDTISRGAISLVLATCVVNAVCSKVKEHGLYTVILCLAKNVTFSVRYGSVLKAYFCADNKIPIPIKENLCTLSPMFSPTEAYDIPIDSDCHGDGQC